MNTLFVIMSVACIVAIVAGLAGHGIVAVIAAVIFLGALALGSGVLS